MKTQRSISVGVAVLVFALSFSSISSFAQVDQQPPRTIPTPPSGRVPQVQVPPPVSSTNAPDGAGPTQPGTPATLPGGMLAPTTEKKKEPVKIPDRKITTEGRMMLIRGMNAELGFARKPFPMGKTGLKLDAATGKITPNDQELDGIMAGYGPSVKPGDRARITEVKIKDKSIVFDINGGPQKKKKWYEHIQVSGGGGSITPGTPTDETNVRGSYVELTFDKFVPDLTPDQIKQLLDPVLNFSSRSATEAYLETIPPKAKQAISDHKVLVGMNREMVTYAKGRPPQKHRERDGDTDYEEWIYGTPPADVEFIRFVGDEVTRVETMKVTGEKVVRTDKEIILTKEQPEVAQQQQPGDQTGRPGQPPAPAPAAASNPDGPQGRPSLKRPGEETPEPAISGPRKQQPQQPGPDTGIPDSRVPPQLTDSR